MTDKETMTPSRSFEDVYAVQNKRIAQLERELSAANARISGIVEECAREVPTSWLDPMLTGDEAVIGKEAHCPSIEAVLNAVAKRIRALAHQSERPADGVVAR